MPLAAPQLVRLAPLVDQALRLDEVARGPWIDSLGDEHRDLAVHLRRALEQVATGGSVQALESLPPFGNDEDEGAKPGGLAPGSTVGPYRLVRHLGSGGMADVWLATPAHGGFRREVALKMPILPYLRQDLEQRFLRERDILAQLAHPNIALLFDAGVDAAGTPFLAMEYVPGQPITKWCDARKLGLRARLALLLQIVDAVDHANRKGVVHRDLKPSNILVGDDGQVKLLDFGVAGLLRADEASELTRSFGRAMTPEYASPEALRGDPIGVRSDIYSLGVLLYELLTGRRPRPVPAGAAVAQWQLALAGLSTLRPSEQIDANAASQRSTTAEDLARAIRGDLERIVCKALAVDPSDRYASAAELGADLRRFQAGDAVLAHRPAVLEGLLRFSIRHRIAVGAFLAACTVGLLVVATRPGSNAALEQAGSSSAPALETGPMKVRSIAVLPFRLRGSDPGQMYLADGLTEELIDRIGLYPGLRVIARNSSFRFRDSSDDARNIAYKLGVSELLLGDVDPAGGRLIVSARLLRGSDGAEIWARPFQASGDDLAPLRDEIAACLASTFHIAAVAQPASMTRSARNARAYNLYLRARYLAYTRRREDIERSLRLYRDSLESDPQYAPALVGLAQEIGIQAAAGLISPAQAIPQMQAALDRAIEIDPRYPAPYYLRGDIHMHKWDWPALRRDLDQVRSLDSGDSRFEAGLQSQIALMLGHYDEAILNLRRVLDHDPISPGAMNLLAFALEQAGRRDEAIAVLRDLVLASPKFVDGYASLATALARKGEFSQALQAAGQEVDEDARNEALAIVDWAMGRREEADRLVRELERHPDQSSYELAQVYASRSDRDAAFRWLDRTYEHHSTLVRWLKMDPSLANLRGDPRFEAFYRKIGLDKLEAAD